MWQNVCNECRTPFLDGTRLFPTQMFVGRGEKSGTTLITRTISYRDVISSDCPWCKLVFERVDSVSRRSQLQPSTLLECNVETAIIYGCGYVIADASQLEAEGSRRKCAMIDRKVYRVWALHGE